MTLTVHITRWPVAKDGMREKESTRTEQWSWKSLHALQVGHWVRRNGLRFKVVSVEVEAGENGPEQWTVVLDEYPEREVR